MSVVTDSGDAKWSVTQSPPAGRGLDDMDVQLPSASELGVDDPGARGGPRASIADSRTFVAWVLSVFTAIHTVAVEKQRAREDAVREASMPPRQRLVRRMAAAGVASPENAPLLKVAGEVSGRDSTLARDIRNMVEEYAREIHVQAHNYVHLMEAVAPDYFTQYKARITLSNAADASRNPLWARAGDAGRQHLIRNPALHAMWPPDAVYGPMMPTRPQHLVRNNLSPYARRTTVLTVHHPSAPRKVCTQSELKRLVDAVIRTARATYTDRVSDHERRRLSRRAASLATDVTRTLGTFAVSQQADMRRFPVDNALRALYTGFKSRWIGSLDGVSMDRVLQFLQESADAFRSQRQEEIPAAMQHDHSKRDVYMQWERLVTKRDVLTQTDDAIRNWLQLLAAMRGHWEQVFGKDTMRCTTTEWMDEQTVRWTRALTRLRVDVRRVGREETEHHAVVMAWRQQYFTRTMTIDVCDYLMQVAVERLRAVATRYLSARESGSESGHIDVSRWKDALRQEIRDLPPPERCEWTEKLLAYEEKMRQDAMAVKQRAMQDSSGRLRLLARTLNGGVRMDAVLRRGEPSCMGLADAMDALLEEIRGWRGAYVPERSRLEVHELATEWVAAADTRPASQRNGWQPELVALRGLQQADAASHMTPQAFTLAVPRLCGVRLWLQLTAGGAAGAHVREVPMDTEPV